MFLKKWPSLLLGTTKFRKIIDKASKDEICGKILHRKVSVIFQQLNALHHIYFHEDHLDDCLIGSTLVKYSSTSGKQTGKVREFSRRC